MTEKKPQSLRVPSMQGEGVFLQTDKQQEAVHLTTNEYSSAIKSPSLKTVSGNSGLSDEGQIRKSRRTARNTHGNR